METTGCLPSRFPVHGMPSLIPATMACDLLPFIAPRTPRSHEYQNEVHRLVNSQRSKHELSQEPRAKRSWNRERSHSTRKRSKREQAAVGFSSSTQSLHFRLWHPTHQPFNEHLFCGKPWGRAAGPSDSSPANAINCGSFHWWLWLEMQGFNQMTTSGSLGSHNRGQSL